VRNAGLGSRYLIGGSAIQSPLEARQRCSRFFGAAHDLRTLEMIESSRLIREVVDAPVQFGYFRPNFP
jgi:hypothetical protein